MVGMLEKEKASKVTFGLVFQPILNQQYITTMLSINPAPKNDRHSKNLRKVGQTLTIPTHTHRFKFCSKYDFCNNKYWFADYLHCDTSSNQVLVLIQKYILISIEFDTFRNIFEALWQLPKDKLSSELEKIEARQTIIAWK